MYVVPAAIATGVVKVAVRQPVVVWVVVAVPRTDPSGAQSLTVLPVLTDEA